MALNQPAVTPRKLPSVIPVPGKPTGWKVWGYVALDRKLFVEVHAVVCGTRFGPRNTILRRNEHSDPRERARFVARKIAEACVARYGDHEVVIGDMIIADPVSQGAAPFNCAEPTASSHCPVVYAHQVSAECEQLLAEAITSRKDVSSLSLPGNIGPCVGSFADFYLHMAGLGEHKTPCTPCRIVVEVHRAQLRARADRSYGYRSCDFGVLNDLQ